MLKARFAVPLALLVISLVSPEVRAGISLNSTRLIIDEARRESTLTVTNNGRDVLVQSWIESGNSDGDAHIAVTPALVRLSADGRQDIRVIYEGQGLPAEKETVLWMSIQEIPPAPDPTKNILQFAVRHRIKVFFRPTGLAGDPAEANSSLKWELISSKNTEALRVTNPSLFHISIANVRFDRDDANKATVIDSTMLSPGETREFPYTTNARDGKKNLTYDVIDDYGALNPRTAELVKK